MIKKKEKEGKLMRAGSTEHIPGASKQVIVNGQVQGKTKEEQIEDDVSYYYESDRTDGIVA